MNFGEEFWRKMIFMSLLLRKNIILIKCGKKFGLKKMRKEERLFYEGRRRNLLLVIKVYCLINVWFLIKGCKYSILGKGYFIEFLIVFLFFFGFLVD